MKAKPLCLSMLIYFLLPVGLMAESLSKSDSNLQPHIEKLKEQYGIKARPYKQEVEVQQNALPSASTKLSGKADLRWVPARCRAGPGPTMIRRAAPPEP